MLKKLNPMCANGQLVAHEDDVLRAADGLVAVIEEDRLSPPGDGRRRLAALHLAHQRQAVALGVRPDDGRQLLAIRMYKMHK
ncbi:hypothetical protein TYRP_000165 [Tyrophagus putrescentiae]|nr:hypothetical protein TYRP_000165 [Tyrophagus putrescentiae]